MGSSGSEPGSATINVPDAVYVKKYALVKTLRLTTGRYGETAAASALPAFTIAQPKLFSTVAEHLKRAGIPIRM